MTAYVTEALKLLYQEKIYLSYKEKGQEQTIFYKHNTFYLQTQLKHVTVQIQPFCVEDITSLLSKNLSIASVCWLKEKQRGIYHFDLLYKYLKDCTNNTALFFLTGLESSFVIKHNDRFYHWTSNQSSVETYHYIPINYDKSLFDLIPTEEMWRFFFYENQVIHKKVLANSVVERLLDVVKRVEGLGVGSLRSHAWTEKCKKECVSYITCWIYNQLHITLPLAMDYMYLVDDLSTINDVIIPYYKQQINI